MFDIFFFTLKAPFPLGQLRLEKIVGTKVDFLVFFAANFVRPP